jgi:pilus assembly protein FimV
MALGFGFNKAKALSAAEKYVQQGKLQNAIAEYDKVSKQDPKDLTVLNTIGDLYARLGRADQASEYFRKVGDAYASDGFVVKAIAMYKKLTKLGTANTDAMVRLAELYTQQGLYNDARAQYMAIADSYLKINDRESATGILKKMLELDPDNAAMQAKVADLYLKLGKNEEAVGIYFHSAQSQYQRGSMEAAEQALQHVLKLDPKYAAALMLRGQIAAESGKSEVAIEHFAKLPDLDSRPEALRPLLQAYVSKGDLEKAGPILSKLVTIHKDGSAVGSYAEALLQAGKYEKALEFFQEHSEHFLSGNKETFAETLVSLVSKVKDSEPALQALLGLLRKAGAAAHATREVQESLAHAYVQNGELQPAAELYQELALAEPENPLHEQNYKQIIARMGKDSATRELSSEEGGQALMVDELEGAPAVVQEYSRDLSEEIVSALTDSELFSSYNVPEKAVVPLERVLAKAPNDVRVRQRLATLYSRLGRFADAANCCTVLSEVHSVAGNTDQAQQLRDLAAKYQQQAGDVAASAPMPEPSSPPAPIGEIAVEPIPFQASSVAGLNLESKAARAEADELEVATSPAEAQAEASAPSEPQHAEQSEAWEDMLTVEAPSADAGGTVQEVTAQDSPDEIAEEARFYLAQNMFAEAQSAIARLETISPSHPAVPELRSLLQASSTASAAEIAPSVEVSPEPKAAPAEEKVHAEVAASPAAAVEVEEAKIEEEDVLGDLVEEEPGEELIPELGSAPASLPPPIPVQPHAPVAAAASPSLSASDDPLAGMLSDLEDALGDIAPAPAAVKHAPSQPSPRPAPGPQVAAAPAVAAGKIDEATSMLSDLLDEFKEEIEEPVAEADDPDTHYNLGVAFREMGLLDEAIGELQKVCRSLETGTAFSQPIQAYTWLAQCLVDKGAPQAAIRWYERALKVSGISEDSKMAVHYDIANAFESAGDKKNALDNFMQVYGSNIDYRDVADRIRSLNK